MSSKKDSHIYAGMAHDMVNFSGLDQVSSGSAFLLINSYQFIKLLSLTKLLQGHPNLTPSLPNYWVALRCGDRKNRDLRVDRVNKGAEIRLSW